MPSPPTLLIFQVLKRIQSLSRCMTLILILQNQLHGGSRLLPSMNVMIEGKRDIRGYALVGATPTFGSSPGDHVSSSPKVENAYCSSAKPILTIRYDW